MPQLGAAGIAAIVSAAAGTLGAIGSTIAASKQSGRNQGMLDYQMNNAKKMNETLGGGPSAYQGLGLGTPTTGEIGLDYKTLGMQSPKTMSGMSSPMMNKSPFMKSQGM